MKVFYILPVVLVLLTSAAFAASPYFFKGYVFVNGSLAPNGTIVEVYVNSASSSSGAAVVGAGQLAGTRDGWYTIGFEANAGDSVVFRVNNLTLNSANGTNTSAQTLVAGGFVTENFNLSANKTANGVSCLYATGCSSGFCADSYCCNTACTDTNYDCNVAGSLGTCTSTATTTTTTGGGGGGTGVAAASETQTLSSVTAGSTNSVSLSQSASLGIEKIDFTTTTSASNVQITIKETTIATAGVSVAITSTQGAVYKYLEITKTNIQNSDISSVTINFKVPKSWLTANNIDKNTIALNRYDSAWSKLPTTIRSEDSTYVYFTATSPGFSTFAITGSKGASFFDVISKIDAYYKGTATFFDVIGVIDLYYKAQGVVA
ncbi:MAG: PGF-pre-PGF domain-containing protein [Candidatus Aenigmatarchaeota archaeon]